MNIKLIEKDLSELYKDDHRLPVGDNWSFCSSALIFGLSCFQSVQSVLINWATLIINLLHNFMVQYSAGQSGFCFRNKFTNNGIGI